MSSQSVSGGSKRSLTIILAIVALIALIVGILWFAGAAPSFLNSGSHVKGTSGNHVYRGTAAVVVALVLGGAAWFTRKK
ncbi:MAG TPA: hypothetical protein VEH05_00105 [Streptosporangiaceae bacterium]|nr:hypothetical protein [Streptosporangiaceae bacterium]